MKMFQNYLAIMICLLLNFSISHAQIAEEPTTGNGTSESPYEISTLGNLLWIQENEDTWDKSFIQTANIDATATQNFYGGIGWMPIGNLNLPFAGSYNGRHFSINNLFLNRNMKYQGLFATLSHSVIDSVILKQVNILSNEDFIGALAGRASSDCNINECIIMGSVRGKEKVGGFVGFLIGSRMNNCQFSGNVKGSNEVGGLIGYVQFGEVTGCISSGRIEGSGNIGGLIGFFEGDSQYQEVNNCGSSCLVIATGYHVGGLIGETREGYVRYCYSVGDVSGGSYTGGFIGRNGAYVQNCYASGSVLGDDKSAGFVYSTGRFTIKKCYSMGKVPEDCAGFVSIASFNSPENCFWDRETSGSTWSAEGSKTPKSTAEMKDIDTYTATSTLGLESAWDFVGNVNQDNSSDDYWNIDSAYNNGYPYFVSQRAIAFEISTDSIQFISPSSLQVSCQLPNLPFPFPNMHGVCWNTTSNPNLNDSVIDIGIALDTGIYSVSIPDYDPFSTYYIRAFAVSGLDTVFGEEISYTHYRNFTLTGSFGVAHKTYDGTLEAAITENNLLLESINEGHDVYVNNVVAQFISSEPNTLGDSLVKVIISEVELAGADAARYYADTMHEVYSNAIIYKKQVFAQGSFEVNNKVYDGSDSAQIMSNSLFVNGIVINDDVQFNYARAKFEKVNANTNVAALLVGSIIEGEQSQCYHLNIDSIQGASATIFPKQVSVGGSFEVRQKYYDGTNTAEIKSNNLFIRDKIENDTGLIKNVYCSFVVATPMLNVKVSIDSISLNDVHKNNYLIDYEEAPIAYADIIGPVYFDVSDIEHGCVYVNDALYTDIMMVTIGSLVKLVAQPDPGFKFDSWSGDFSSTQHEENIKVDSNMNITVVFSEIQKYEVNVTIIGNGTLLINNESYMQDSTYLENTKVELKAVADIGWKFDAWSGDFESENINDSLTINYDKDIVLAFSNENGIEQNMLNDLRISPNPFTDEIIFTNSEIISELNIFNISGELIKTIPNPATKIDLGDLVQGVYFVKISSSKGGYKVHRMVKD